MHILHVIPYLHPRAGGPPVVVQNLIAQTSKRGHISEIITTPAMLDKDEWTTRAGIEWATSVKLIARHGRLASLFDSSAQELEQPVRQAEIVHVHTLWNPINYLVRKVCDRLGRPYVLMPHG